VSESTPAGAPRHGAMRLLSPAQRRQWQDETLHSPRLRYGIPAWLLFRLEDVVFGPGRSIPKFRALEIINRVAYQAWEQAAYYLAGKLGERSARARQLHDTVEEDRTEQDNEKWHVLILDELEAAQGRRESWLRFRLLPQLIAFAVYQQFWLMRVLRPAWAYRFNADIEDHAEHEYAQFVAEHPEWDATPFQSLAAPEYGRYDSLADVLRQIGDDEGVHKRISLDRLTRAR
jgi:ubiquinol oxidase